MSYVLPLSVFVLWHIFYNFAYILYEVLLLGIYGQTIGKRLMKVIVLDVNEKHISFTHAILRDIVPIIATTLGVVLELPLIIKGIDPAQHYLKNNIPWHYWVMVYSMLGWFALELITMLSNNKRRALHDFIAGTIVIRKE